MRKWYPPHFLTGFSNALRNSLSGVFSLGAKKFKIAPPSPPAHAHETPKSLGGGAKIEYVCVRSFVRSLVQTVFSFAFPLQGTNRNTVVCRKDVKLSI